MARGVKTQKMKGLPDEGSGKPSNGSGSLAQVRLQVVPESLKAIPRENKPLQDSEAQASACSPRRTRADCQLLFDISRCAALPAL